MKKIKLVLITALMLMALTTTFCCNTKAETNNVADGATISNTPFTDLPAELTGTWYPDHNANPLTENWEQQTFQGEQGFREFRTMVFTATGKNAFEYRTEITNAGGEVKKYFYRIQGTTTYINAELKFYAVCGEVRVFSNKYSSFKTGKMTAKELQDHYSVLRNPSATSVTGSVNYLNARRFNGGNEFTVKYKQAQAGNSSAANGSGLYATPPTSGTYVKIAEQYYPTVTIGHQEWMAVNYYGTGGMKDATRPAFGTFYKYADLQEIPVPAGWRIPSKADYISLLKSQGISFDERWNTTDGSDITSKKLLGQLMATKAWKKQDGYANNRSGFAAVPANLRVINGNPHGEGSNCQLWTSDRDASDLPCAFKLIQLPTDTYAEISGLSQFTPPHLPVRLVRDR